MGGSGLQPTASSPLRNHPGPTPGLGSFLSRERLRGGLLGWDTQARAHNALPCVSFSNLNFKSLVRLAASFLTSPKQIRKLLGTHSLYQIPYMMDLLFLVFLINSALKFHVATGVPGAQPDKRFFPGPQSATGQTGFRWWALFLIQFLPNHFPNEANGIELHLVLHTSKVISNIKIGLSRDVS